MNREEFLEQMQDVLQTDKKLSFDTKLNELAEWDSMSAMSTIAFLDNCFGVQTNYIECAEMETIEDIAKKAGI